MGFSVESHEHTLVWDVAGTAAGFCAVPTLRRCAGGSVGLGDALRFEVGGCRRL